MYLVLSLLLYLATYTLATSTLSASVLSCLPYCSTYSSGLLLSSTSSLDPASQQTQKDMDTVLQGRLAFITASVTQVSQIASWYVNHAMSVFILSNPNIIGYKPWAPVEAGLHPRSIIQPVVLRNALTGQRASTGPESVCTIQDSMNTS